MNANATGSVFERLAWDSEFFGFNVGRINTTSPSLGALEHAIHQARAQNTKLVYFLCDPHAAHSVRGAEALGFRLTDLRVELQCSVKEVAASETPAAAGLRVAGPSDLAQLKLLSAGAFTSSRFYADETIADADCDRFYETWIENYVSGGLGQVLVADRGNGALDGYIALSQSEGVAKIGLVTVAEPARGSGLGAQLVNAAIAWAGAQTAIKVSVVTHGRDAGTQRLYMRCGFSPISTQLWYHWSDA